MHIVIKGTTVIQDEPRSVTYDLRVHCRNAVVFIETLLKNESLHFGSTSHVLHLP